MLDILKKFDAAQNSGRQNLNECGDQAMSSPATPVTVNITAPNAQDMAAMLKALASIESGAGAMPSTPLAIAADKMEADFESPCNMKNDEEVINSEAFVNEPDEEYADHNFMTKDLSGGINRQKKMYPPAAKGDNPMAVESIKDRLLRALNEKKAKPDFLDTDKDGNKKEPMKKAVADKKKVKEATYLPTNPSERPTQLPNKKAYDIEKASEKSKEKPVSLKKAPWDKKKTDSVKEAAKPDFLDMDKDGNKKEPMKKAVADKKKTNESDAAKAVSDKLKKSKPSYRDPNAKNAREEDTLAKKLAKNKVKETTVNEGRRLVKKAENGSRAVKIYWDNEWEEFIVQHFENGQYMQDADYFDSDKEGAVDTAKHFLQGAAVSEISRDTLGRYAAKAHRRGDMASRMYSPSKSNEFNKDMGKIANKRYDGVQTAINKLSGRAKVNPKK
jgi:chemotaxis protein histidine kinase CheA